MLDMPVMGADSSPNGEPFPKQVIAKKQIQIILI